MIMFQLDFSLYQFYCQFQRFPKNKTNQPLRSLLLYGRDQHYKSIFLQQYCSNITKFTNSMFWVIFILCCFGYFQCFSVNATRQKIFDDVFTSMTKDTGCVDHTAFIETLYKALLKDMIVAEDFRDQRGLFKQMIQKYNIVRRWYSMDHYQNQICVLSKQAPNIYTPPKDPTTLKLSVKDTIDQYPYLKQNISPQKITSLLSKLSFRTRHFSEFRRYIILDHKLYSQRFGDIQLGDQFYERYITPYLSRLPDMDFIMSRKQDFQFKQYEYQVRKQSGTFSEYLGKMELQKRILIQLPMIAFQKGVQNQMQFNKFLIPDNLSLFTDYWSQNIKDIAQGAEIYEWQNKIEKAYYRSQVSPAQNNEYQLEGNIPKYWTNIHLVNISRHNRDLLDAQFAGKSNNDWDWDAGKLDFYFSSQKVQQPSDKDMQKYKYLISVDGSINSTLKTNAIMCSSSVLFKHVGSKVLWYYDKLIPNYHFIPLNRTVDDVLDKVREMRQNDGLSKQIVKNANQFCREHLTAERVIQQFIRTLLDYAQVQKLSMNFLQKFLSKISSTQVRNDILMHVYQSLLSLAVVLSLCLGSAMVLLKSSVGQLIQDSHAQNKEPSAFWKLMSKFNRISNVQQ